MTTERIIRVLNEMEDTTNRMERGGASMGLVEKARLLVKELRGLLGIEPVGVSRNPEKFGSVIEN